MARVVFPVLLVVLITLLLAPVPRVGAEPDEDKAARRTPTVLAVEKASPAVVSISTKRIAERDPFYDEFFGRYRGRGTREVKGVGSGVVIHPDGYVVTNHHVVKRATEIIVGLEVGGKEAQFAGLLIAEDEAHDLALVKISAGRPLPAIGLGRSDDLMIGEPVIAVGNPFGVGKTVTTGVLSAKGRAVRREGGGASFKDFLQTDAAINPGNSGGPLINILGQMIGVNTAIIRGGEGIGFAIPVNRVKDIINRLIEAAVHQANLGFTPVSEAAGVTVRAVNKTGAAEQGGLRAGDLIERVDGRPVRSVFDFATPLLAKGTGDPVRISIRRGGNRMRVDLMLPMSPQAEYVARRIGIVGRDLTPADEARGLTGVVVEEVLPNSPADRVKIQGGDLIVVADRWVVSDLITFARVLAREPKGGTIDIEVNRKGRQMRGSVTLR